MAALIASIVPLANDGDTSRIYALGGIILIAIVSYRVFSSVSSKQASLAFITFTTGMNVVSWLISTKTASFADIRVMRLITVGKSVELGGAIAALSCVAIASFWSVYGVKNRLFVCLTMIFNALTVLASGCRASLVTLLFVPLIAIYRTARYPFMLWSQCAAFCIFAIVLHEANYEWSGGMKSDRNIWITAGAERLVLEGLHISTSQRVKYVWPQYWAVISSRAIWGTGGIPKKSERPILIWPHNTFVYMFFALGLVGGILFSIWFLYFMCASVQHLPK